MWKNNLACCAFACGAGLVQAAPLLSESFDDVASLEATGWVMQNFSDPVGRTGWFQGNTVVFASASGAPNAYIAANYNNTVPDGTLSNWLMTPALQLSADAQLSFALRGPLERPYFDLLEVYIGTRGASTDVDDFRLLAAFTTQQQVISAWQTHTLALPGATGFNSRLAFRYAGSENHANYIGLDDVRISAPREVPEPTTAALLACGLLGLAARRHLTAPGARS